jgi:8-oxo-dGTP pyrophosphatase MutT (NUDIX family)
VKVRFSAIGRWEAADVLVRWVADNRPRAGEIEKIIEQTWESARSRPGLNLFDGPMCRLERFSAGKILELDVSPTSYRVFWGTNLNNSWLGGKYGAQSLANAIGLSCALESADGFLLLGRRNAGVAYYPSRVHPFAGTLEPAETVDVFAEVGRELTEELGLRRDDLTHLVCTAIIEDISIGQPELVFSAKSSRSRSQLQGMLDASEHDSLIAIEPTRQNVESSLKDSAMTPVALGTILLWGREHFGTDWFDAAERAVNLGES